MEGIYHPSVGRFLSKVEYEANASHDIPSGTSFPVSPSERDWFYRTDLNMFYYYNGTDWVTTGLRFEEYAEFNLGTYSTYTPVDAGVYFLISTRDFQRNDIEMQVYDDLNLTWYDIGHLINDSRYSPTFLSDGSHVKLYNGSFSGYVKLWRMF